MNQSACSHSAESKRSVRDELATSLRRKADQIESAIEARIRDLGGPVGEEDVAYVEGRRSAVMAAFRYALLMIEDDVEPRVPVPLEIARQARRAARSGVRLDTALRRFAAGSNLFGGFVVAESQRAPAAVLQQVLSPLAPQVDRMMELIAAEYRDEQAQMERSTVQKQADHVLRLLADDALSPEEGSSYDFDDWHLGLILVGRSPETTARLLAERMGCQSLQVVRDSETVWLWLGSRKKQLLEGLEQLFEDHLSGGTPAAAGEPRMGVAGWRLTHREAQIALQVMMLRPQSLTRCKDAVLLAGVLRDQTLLRSLLDNYLAPLKQQGDAGQAVFQTLRAYFSSGGNAAAAAASVGITRQTVQRRIRAVEKSLGQPLYKCQAALEVALAIDELDQRN